MEEEYKDRIKRAGYKLGGQIKTLDNAKALAKELNSLSGLLVEKTGFLMDRGIRKDIDSLVDDIESCRKRLVYKYDSAIDQNMNIRRILETGEEYDDQ